MYATNLHKLGFHYLANLQLDELVQLRDELDALWKNGQSKISNNIYDKIIDSINYELTQLKIDPYEYAIRKTDDQIKNLVNFLTKLHMEKRGIVDNTTWDILNQELTLRNVLPISINTTINYPSNWTTMSMHENPIQFISLAPTSSEYQEIEKLFSGSLQKSSVIIYSITRIQNLRLLYIFQQLQKQIPNSTSQRLFHGTASIAHQKLIKYHGFARSFCPNGLIGDGVYFAVQANYSNNNPYVLKRTNHRRELFVCQVLLGNSTQGSNGMKSIGQNFHSVYHHYGQVNDMFCIFNNYQAYPEYIIQYDYE